MVRSFRHFGIGSNEDGGPPLDDKTELGEELKFFAQIELGLLSGAYVLA